MVDTIVDNLSLRTQRKAEIKLELALDTPSDKISSLRAEILTLLQHPIVVSRNVLLSDITPNAFLLHCEYFTDAVPLDDFNDFKQDLNLRIIRLLEERGIEIAGVGKKSEAR
jgi:MscS family membrane protein